MSQRIGGRNCLQYTTIALLCALGCGTGGKPESDAPGSMPSSASTVLPGIDMLLADSALYGLRGQRLGLITNHTGLTADGRSTIDALHAHPGLDLVALYSPEHGIRGTAAQGETIQSGRDERTGLPIHSLYGDTREPTAAMLEDVDVLLFDIQDIGARFYTYIWTMALAQKAAGEHGKRFVVLDRPNPIGGVQVQGNVLDTAYATFVGLYPVPTRHGMTVGEMARFLNAEYGFDTDLTVVPAGGWTRATWFDATGLTWHPPSPNMPNLESATHYTGTCLFEGTNLSVGRGTTQAYQHVGAPWIDGPAWAARLQAHNIPGVRFEAVTFTPRNPGDQKYDGVELSGVRLHVTDRDAYDPTRAAITMLVELQAMHGDSLEFLVAHFDRLVGTSAVREGLLAGANTAQITAAWDAEIAAFDALRRKYLIYE